MVVSEDKRRPSQNVRKHYKKRHPWNEGLSISQSTDHGESDDSDPEDALRDWDDLIMESSGTDED